MVVKRLGGLADDDVITFININNVSVTDLLFTCNDLIKNQRSQSAWPVTD